MKSLIPLRDPELGGAFYIASVIDVQGARTKLLAGFNSKFILGR